MCFAFLFSVFLKTMETEDLVLLKQKWEKLTDELSKQFGEKPDLQIILFLIGVQETGKGFAKYSKDDKQNLMHVATCVLLSQYGYYGFDKIDEDGWPHYTPLKKIPPMSLREQDIMLKKAVVNYFESKEEK
jgi:hypothetical protein